MSQDISARRDVLEGMVAGATSLAAGTSGQGATQAAGTPAYNPNARFELAVAGFELRAAGGECDYRLFESSVHEWVAEPGPQTDGARETVREFIARQLKV